MWKCPSCIQCGDSNSWPLEHESPSITTRPGLRKLLLSHLENNFISTTSLYFLVLNSSSSFWKGIIFNFQKLNHRFIWTRFSMLVWVLCKLEALQFVCRKFVPLPRGLIFTLKVSVECSKNLGWCLPTYLPETQTFKDRNLRILSHIRLQDYSRLENEAEINSS